MGALAAKPALEGKVGLFDKFGGVEAVDICIDEPDPSNFINVVRHLHPSFGAISLEGIKAPDCFIIERVLKEITPIPVFHDA